METVPAECTDRYPKIQLDSGVLDAADAVLLSSEPYSFQEGHVAELRAEPLLAKKKDRPHRRSDDCVVRQPRYRGLGYLRRFRETLGHSAR